MSLCEIRQARIMFKVRVTVPSNVEFIPCKSWLFFGFLIFGAAGHPYYFWMILPCKMFVAVINDNFATYRLYSGVRNWTLRLTGGKEHIAVIRASGSVRRFRGPLSAPTAGIVAEQLIQRIRSVRGVSFCYSCSFKCTFGIYITEYRLPF